MKLKNTLIKLTLGYLLMIMLVSGILSIVIYTVGQQPLHRRMHMQQRVIEDFIEGDVPVELDSYAVEEVRRQMLLFLIYFNIGVLCLAGIVSYGLARRELKPLEEAMELQGRFTSDAAHELRTPLTAMRAEIEVALRSGELDPAEARELLESNLEEIAKLESLSSSLLKLAQYEDGQAAPDEDIPVGRIVDGAIDRVKRAASQKNITIAADLPDLWVRGDRDSLVELFVILLDNSIKYSDEGRRIDISAIADRRRVEVIVVDQGYGISEEDLQHVFDRFYRGRFPSEVPHASGYGLGLSIASRIAELNHAVIEMESQPGEGTRATVRLRSERGQVPPTGLSTPDAYRGQVPSTESSIPGEAAAPPAQQSTGAVGDQPGEDEVF